MAKFCRYCGSPIQEGVKFCPECGKQLADDIRKPQPQQAPVQQPPRQPDQQPVRVYGQNVEPAAKKTVTPALCPKCGAVLNEQVKFCRMCGSPVSQTTQSGPVHAPTETPARYTGTGQTDPPLQQTVRNAAGQAVSPVLQAANGLGGLVNSVKAMPVAGESSLDLPGLSVPTEAKSGGMPGFVKFLISVAAGGISIPVLNQLGSPWSFLAGAAVSVLLIVISSKIKKSRGGAR